MFVTKTLLPFAGLMLPVMATNIDLPPRQTAHIEPNVAQGHFRALAPEPTAGPSAREARDRFAAMQLFQRDNVGINTCGFISGTSPYPVACAPGTTCTGLGDYRGCCNDDTCTSSDYFYHACYDYSATECDSSVNPNTLCCNSNTQLPYCVTYLYSTSTNPGFLYTQFNCDQLFYSGTQFLLANKPSAAPTPSTTTSSDATQSTPTTSRAPIVPGGSQESGTNDTNSDGNSSGDNNSSSSSTGAIVGGVIGGVAVIALIAFGAFFLVRKRKNNAAASAGGAYQSPPQMSGYPSPSHHPGQSPGGTVYDPHDPNSMYSPSAMTAAPTHNGGYSPYATPAPGVVPNNNNPAYAGAYAVPPQHHEYYKNPQEMDGTTQAWGPPPQEMPTSPQTMSHEMSGAPAPWAPSQETTHNRAELGP